MNAILQELDLIGLDLQMEIDGFSDVTTPPTKIKETNVIKSETNVIKSLTKIETSPKNVEIKQLQKEYLSKDRKGDKVAQVEPKGRTRGGRTPGGLKLSYNAENNYPESMVCCCCCCCCCSLDFNYCCF